MRTLFIVPALALGLSGCVTAGDPTSVGTLAGTIGAAVVNRYAPDVGKAVAGRCGFVVTAAEYLNLAERYPSVIEAAKAICAELEAPRATWSSSSAATTVIVKGATVTGHFKRPPPKKK